MIEGLAGWKVLIQISHAVLDQTASSLTLRCQMYSLYSLEFVLVGCYRSRCCFWQKVCGQLGLVSISLTYFVVMHQCLDSSSMHSKSCFPESRYFTTKSRSIMQATRGKNQ